MKRFSPKLQTGDHRHLTSQNIQSSRLLEEEGSEQEGLELRLEEEVIDHQGLKLEEEDSDHVHLSICQEIQ